MLAGLYHRYSSRQLVITRLFFPWAFSLALLSRATREAIILRTLSYLLFLTLGAWEITINNYKKTPQLTALPFSWHRAVCTFVSSTSVPSKMELNDSAKRNKACCWHVAETLIENCGAELREFQDRGSDRSVRVQTTHASSAYVGNDTSDRCCIESASSATAVLRSQPPRFLSFS